MNRLAHRQLARVRLKWCQAKHSGLSYYKVGRKFNVSPSSVRLWYLRWKGSGYRFDSLYNARPQRGTPANARRDIEGDLRALYASGLRSHRLQKALKRRGHTVARSTMYANIQRLGLAENPSPKPKRKSAYRTIEWPLGWVQADTMWPWGNQGPVQYTAIECRSRLRFLRLYPDCTPDQLAKIAERHKIATQTTYGIVRGTQRPSFVSLAGIHVALEELLQRRVELDEILELER